MDLLDSLCESCGLSVADGAAGCRGLFEEVIAREFSDFRYGRLHRLTVDVYSLQHPEQYMRSAKSFAAHLTGMKAALENQNNPGKILEINAVVQKWLSTNPVLSKPAQLPDKRGELKVSYVHSAANADEHLGRILEWANSTWLAWSEHHELARQMIDEAFRKGVR
jgi:hypothetical protein